MLQSDSIETQEPQGEVSGLVICHSEHPLYLQRDPSPRALPCLFRTRVVPTARSQCVQYVTRFAADIFPTECSNAVDLSRAPFLKCLERGGIK